MFNVVLYQPEIPPNTGNIIRLCANVGAKLHLIKPLGFTIDDKQLRRAGLDYYQFVSIKLYENLDDFLQQVNPPNLWACTTKGKTQYTTLCYGKDDAFLFGPETRGLPSNLLDNLMPSQLVYIPMQSPTRSLNLSNSVAIVLYEAWRQFDFLSSPNG